MSKMIKRILSVITACALVLTFTLFAIAVEEENPEEPGIGDDITAPPASVESITFTVSSYVLSKGETAATELEIKPDGVEGYTIEYSTSDENVATVDENGVITAVGDGEATITAKCGELKCTTSVTVSSVQLSIDQDHTMEKYVSGFSIGMTVDAAKVAFAKHNKVNVEDLKILSDSSEPSGGALLATGMVIEEGSGIFYNVVVAGDVDGTGTITYDDARTVISVLSGGAFDNTACERAAKFNGNEELSVKTALDISDYVSGRITFED